MSGLAKYGILISALVCTAAWVPVAKGARATRETAKDHVESKDFRDSIWGISRAEVEKLEALRGTQPHPWIAESDETLVYRAMVVEEPCRIWYYFHDDELVRGLYHFATSVNEDSRDFYGKVFNKMRGLLEEKYGQAKTDDKSEADQRTGVSLSYSITWETDRTNIELSLSLEERGMFLFPVLRIIYVDRNYVHLFEDEPKEDFLRDL